MTISDRLRQARKGAAIAAGAALELILLLGVDAPKWALAAVPVLTAIAGYGIPNDPTPAQRQQVIAEHNRELLALGERLGLLRRRQLGASSSDVSRET